MLSLNLNEKGGKKGEKIVSHSWKARRAISPWDSDQQITIFLKEEMCYLVRKQDQHLSRTCQGTPVCNRSHKVLRKWGDMDSKVVTCPQLAMRLCYHSTALYPTCKLDLAQRFFQWHKSFDLIWNFHEYPSHWTWPTPALHNTYTAPSLAPSSATSNQSPTCKTQSL